MEGGVLCIGIGMTCTLRGLIQYHMQFMCSIIACLIYDQANIGGAIYSPSSPHGSYTYAVLHETRSVKI